MTRSSRSASDFVCEWGDGDDVGDAEHRADDGVREAVLPAGVHDWRAATTPRRGKTDQWVPAKYLERLSESILNCFIQYDAFSISEIGNEFLKRQLLVLVKQKICQEFLTKIVQVKEFKPRIYFVYTFVWIREIAVRDTVWGKGRERYNLKIVRPVNDWSQYRITSSDPEHWSTWELEWKFLAVCKYQQMSMFVYLLFL